MSEQFPEIPFPEQLAATFDTVGSSRVQNQLLQGLPRNMVTETRSAIRKPTTELVQASGEQWGEVISIMAEETFKDRPTDVVNILAGYGIAVAASCYAIDQLKIRTTGTMSNTNASNGIMGVAIEAAGRNLVGNYYDVLYNDKTVPHQYSWLFDPIFTATEHRKAWLAPKLYNLSAAINTYMGLSAFSESFKNDAEIPAETEALAAANDALFSRASLLQEYGVKPAVARSRLPGTAVREWLVDNEREHTQRRTQQAANSGSAVNHNFIPARLAAFMATDQRFVTSRLSYFDLPINGTTRATVINTHDLVAAVDVDKQGVDCLVGLSKAGNLTTMHGVDLEPIMPRLAYEAMRSDILAIYTDLVVPVYVTDLFHDEEVSLKKSEPTATNTDQAAMRRLVLSRERVLAALADDIVDALDKESSRESIETARHGVVGHVRRLPGHYRASTAAREQCLKEIGVELADRGETYVRFHDRGSYEAESKGHKVTLSKAASYALKNS